MKKLIFQVIACLFIISCGVDTSTNKNSSEYIPKSEEEKKPSVEELNDKSENVREEAEEKSIHKNTPCEELMDKYKKAIELLKNDSDSDEGRKLYKSMRNDPIVNGCRSDEKYKASFKALDKEYYSSRKK